MVAVRATPVLLRVTSTVMTPEPTPEPEVMVTQDDCVVAFQRHPVLALMPIFIVDAFAMVPRRAACGVMLPVRNNACTLYGFVTTREVDAGALARRPDQPAKQ